MSLVLIASTSIARCLALNIASCIGICSGRTERAIFVESSKSGIHTVISQSWGQSSFLYTIEPSSSCEAITKPPRIAGATLSGCPSTSVAIERSAVSSAGEPKSLFAAISPPTITAAELPRPLVIGICDCILIFNSEGSWPIEL